ncbi:MAG TPA: 2-dehydro-3-deoxygalactonokinase [Casimicrobiaceae bacterium]|nr:2-dehydro-3-deoxygalactonokinase [Casimicrobiaceae bacterium]
MPETALIAIDWGTSAARAYRLGADGRVQERRNVPLGIKHVRDRHFEAALGKLIGDWQAMAAPKIACGMIGSRQGWVEVPYVDCPASLTALADRVQQAPQDALAIVPGVATRDSAGIPDVMRGEETQLLGALAANERGVLAVLPGTHSKWARVEHGRIVDFTTFMTGELFGVLIDHTMLGRLAGHEPGQFARDGFARGVARGLDEGALAHDIFGARTLSLTGSLRSEEVADWLSGLLIGREIRAARAWALRTGIDTARVRIIGSDALAERYELALADAGMLSERGADDAAAHGLFRIAQRAGIVAAAVDA